MKRIKIVLANAEINSGNKGCSALGYSSLYFIDKVLSENGMEYELYLIVDRSREGIVDGSLQIGERTINYRVVVYPLDCGIRDVVKKLVSFPRTLRGLFLFGTADYILNTGQGDSFSDIYGARRFYRIDKIHRIARRLNRPYCMLPQTIGPFNDSRLRAKACKSIAKACYVMARDRMSFDFVKNHVPRQVNVSELIDIAFFLPYKKVEFDKSLINVGLNISGLLWHGGYTGRNEFGLKDDYQKTVREIIDFFIHFENVKLHLVPHVVDKDRIRENDYAVSLDLVNEYSNPQIVLSPFFFSPTEAKGYISGLDFFIGARMHSTIAAFSSGVPVVPMSYSRKFNGLFINSLDYEYLVDLRVNDTKSIVSFIKNWFENRNELRHTIQSRAEVIKRSKDLLLEDLKSFFLMPSRCGQ